jgi:hypothetical protein
MAEETTQTSAMPSFEQTLQYYKQFQEQETRLPLEIEQEPQEVAGMREQYDKMIGQYETQVKGIQEDPGFNVDYSAAIGEYKQAFEKTKGRILEQAGMAIKKQAMEADAYFGSTGSDQRSSARLKMANDLYQGMYQTAFQNIGAIYDKQAETILGTQVAETNKQLEASMGKAAAIAEVTGQASTLYANTLSEINKNYLGRLSAAVQYATDSANLQGDMLGFITNQAQLKYQYDKANLDAALSVYKERPALFYGDISMGKTTGVRATGDVAASTTAETSDFFNPSGMIARYAAIGNLKQVTAARDAALRQAQAEADLSGYGYLGSNKNAQVRQNPVEAYRQGISQF